jgi:hypothetical protein
MRIVSSLDQLANLPRDRTVNGFGSRAPLRLEIPAVTRHSLLRAERALNRLQSRCGCMAGAIATLIAIGAGTFDLFRSGSLAWSWDLPVRVLLVLTAAFLLGLAAKFVTLVATRWQFARACHVHVRALARDAGGGFSEE